MDIKTKKMLTLLDNQIQQCEECNLWENGRAKPYWSENSKYMMILEAPGKEEVEHNETLIGKTGRMFWNIAAEYQLRKQDFLIMNSVNCRVMNGKKNGKPSETHRDCCRIWLRKYIKVFQPRKLILCGNYALHTVLGLWGITKFYDESMLLTHEDIYGINVDVVKSIHPSAMIYSKDKEKDLRKSIELIKE